MKVMRKLFKSMTHERSVGCSIQLMDNLLPFDDEQMNRWIEIWDNDQISRWKTMSDWTDLWLAALERRSK